jgi:hypothetical protein
MTLPHKHVPKKEHTISGLVRKEQLWRIPLLAAAIAALLASLWGGLLRIGWQWPVIQPTLAGIHGPLIVSGFFGTVIGLERAVALQLRWPYFGPILTALGGILLLAGVKSPVPALLLTAGSFWLVLVFVEIVRRHLVSYTVVMALGALTWSAGNALWLLGWPVHRIVLWWAAFLILTIAGERLELGRLVRQRPYVSRIFHAGTALFLAGLLLSFFSPDIGVRIASLGLISLAAWLLRYDIARRTIHQTGLPRFAAVCLLTGYVWLGVGGGIGLWFGAVPAGFYYDAFIHTIFLGFVFAMIFAHAPIIFPAILKLPVRYSPVNYLPLVLLHLSLLLRVAGDLLFHPQLRAWGGLLNGVTILAFLIIMVWSIVRSLTAGRNPRISERPPELSDEEVKEAANQPWIRWLWAGVLAAFLVAGLTGSLMRFWMIDGIPAGLDFLNVRHAHSHLMYFGWVAPALMLLIASYLPAQTRQRLPGGMRWAIGAVLFFGLLSYLPFFFWGYQPASLGSTKVPLSIAISTLNILAWYAYAISYRRATRKVRANRPIRLWNAALLFLLAASFGAWGRAILSALKIEDAFLSAAAVHLFLDLFSNGWAVVGLLGVAYASKPRLAKTISGWEDPLLFVGLPLAFLLGVPVDLVPADLRTLAGIGGLLAATGLCLHIRNLWPHFSGQIWGGWRAPLAFLLLKAGLDAAGSLSPLARWAESMDLRIFYLHILLLGFVSMALLTGGMEIWGKKAKFYLFLFTWSTIGLLASLIPLTRLWPSSWAGSWQLWAAFLFSLGPLLAIIPILAMTPWRRGEKGPAEKPQDEDSMQRVVR